MNPHELHLDAGKVTNRHIEDEREHFIQCTLCGQWYDRRVADFVMYHHFSPRDHEPLEIDA